MQGAHLEYIGPGEWQISGRMTAYVKQDPDEGKYPWRVLDGRRLPCGAYSRMQHALATAYSIATTGEFELTAE